jgi:hypothetical protein
MMKRLTKLDSLRWRSVGADSSRLCRGDDSQVFALYEKCEVLEEGGDEGLTCGSNTYTMPECGRRRG